MHKRQLRTDERRVEELTEENNGILDRLIGTDQRGSRSIPRLRSGYLPARQYPKPTDTLRWINVTNGEETLVSVRHAVDYVLYVNGNHRISASVRDNIGERFDADPRYAIVPPKPPADEGDADHANLEALLSFLGETATTPPPPEPSPTISVHVSSCVQHSSTTGWPTQTPPAPST
ncbi:hypothetical protein PHYPSEUDO_011751 [Phytophthora pseudosyringae]|uniref:Uncharacterized protein n=1 Tax=Phytophthora pseudosyringae TaxID=221518 RepID=A0A8T1V8M5_9STRA|nr:hypothetical protein PHYPSEUDO_011751 [Phytophthora pseudosyringae]